MFCLDAASSIRSRLDPMMLPASRFLGVLLLVAAGALPATPGASAQGIGRLAIKFGLASSTIDTPQIPDRLKESDRRRLAPSVFVEVEAGSRRPLALAVEAGYAPRGVVYQHDRTNADGERVGVVRFPITLDYISAGVTAKAYAPFKAVRPYALAGVRLGVLVHDKTVAFEGGQVVEVHPQYSRTAYGLAGGIGLSSEREGRRSVFGELRYHRDLSRLEPSIPTTETYNAAVEILEH